VNDFLECFGIAIALISLLFGFYKFLKKRKIKTLEVKQKSTGDNSPNIQSKGNVDVNYGKKHD
jgi:hypothetical protein